MSAAFPNPATQWATTFVEELVSGGLAAVCIAPGSRSTSLALAFAAQPDLPQYLFLDERSAGFFALGLALAGEQPAALLCTSGTATANFFPAIIEARMSQVPLLVLTADRPPELRHSGANQTIDQVKLYGDQALWFVDVALPEPDAPEVALRNLRTLAARALATANGIVKGPVHLNFPFRKPFEPDIDHEQPARRRAPRRPATQMLRGRLTPTLGQIKRLVDLVNHSDRGVIVCGPGCPGEGFPEAVATLAHQAGYPLLADPLSGLRFGPWVEKTTILGGYETYLDRSGPELAKPDLVLRFGAPPTSKWLGSYLARSAVERTVHVRNSGVWGDDSFRTSLFLQAEETEVCRQLASAFRVLPARASSDWLERFREIESGYWRRLSEKMATASFDGAIIPDLLDVLPDGALLFVGNSLPIRHVDQFGRPGPKRLRLFGNRGASGIDGNISTGLGLAAAANERVVILLGDITMLHDLTALQTIRRHGLRATIVLLNNNGGGIFHRLPVRAHDPPFTELFLTPHGLDFAPAAQMFGLEYLPVEGKQSFRQAFAAGLAGDASQLIEVRTESGQDAEDRTALIMKVNHGLRIEFPGQEPDNPSS